MSTDSSNLTLLAERFKKSLATYNDAALIQNKVCHELVQIPKKFGYTHFETAFEIGCGTGLLTTQFLEHYPVNLYWANDLVDESRDYLELVFATHKPTRWHFMGGDAERNAFPPGCDIILSASALHWFTDWQKAIQRAYDHLNPGGLFCFSLYGVDTFKEITALTGNGLRYRTLAEHHTMLIDKFEILIEREYTDALWFTDPLTVLKHIKQTGVGGYFKRTWNKEARHNFINGYWSTFAKNGRIPLTYHPLFFLCRKRTEV